MYPANTTLLRTHRLQVTEYLLAGANEPKESLENNSISLKLIQELHERSKAKIRELVRRNALSEDERAIASAEGVAG